MKIPRSLSKLAVTATVAALACQLPLAHGEMTTPQTIVFEAAEDGTYTDFIDEDLQILAYSDLTGFTKFDPALGTLTKILLTAEVEGSFTTTISADDYDLIDPDSSFTLFYDASAGISVQTDIVYSRTGGNSGISTGSQSFQSSAYLGDFDIDPLELSEDYEDGATEDLGGFANGGSTQLTGSLLASAVNLADFVGTDGNPVSGLSLYSFAFVENEGMSGIMENLSHAYLEFQIGHVSRSATIQYVYTPAGSAPAPQVTSYQKSGDTHTILFTGEAGQTTWQVFGGPDLIDFSTDYTGSAAITEPSAGNYQLVMTLTDLPTDRYFFRIKQ